MLKVNNKLQDLIIFLLNLQQKLKCRPANLPTKSMEQNPSLEAQQINKFHRFYWTPNFITVSTKAHHFRLLSAIAIHSKPTQYICLWSILILSSQLCPGLLKCSVQTTDAELRIPIYMYDRQYALNSKATLCSP